MREDLAVMTLNEGVRFPGVEYLKERVWKEAHQGKERVWKEAHTGNGQQI